MGSLSWFPGPYPEQTGNSRCDTQTLTIILSGRVSFNCFSNLQAGGDEYHLTHALQLVHLFAGHSRSMRASFESLLLCTRLSPRSLYAISLSC